jgi:pantoate--beta-alanine ligase
MLVFKTVAALQSWVQRKRAGGALIGFVPTMGALHDGHLELVRLAKRAGDLAVASIFVNPTQFNDPGDLKKYPRTPGRDLEMLLSVHCDAVFMPSEEEIYPPGRDISVNIDLGILDKVMEGAFRPGHFKGMMTVVKRLLEIVQPDNLYMGQKDFQQLTIVANMIWELGLDVQLVMCHTVREHDGLAMSSRNVRLSPEQRRLAPLIYKTLQEARSHILQQPVSLIAAQAVEQLSAAGFRPEYFEIVDGYTLQTVSGPSESDLIVACVAAWLGEVRLIDNLILKNDR